MTETRLTIVIPCYNEEKVLPETVPMFLEKLHSLIESGLADPDSRLLFVDDGSSDATWPILSAFAEQDSHCTAVALSRNRGHQNALWAGLMEARETSDVTISIDCDGQDDLAAMDKMLEAHRNGYDIVYGVRSDRSSDTAFKRGTAQLFYKLLKHLGAEVVYNHADYRLISRRALDELSRFREVNLYLRGLIPLVGFPSTTVYYERKERIAGSTHYSLRKMTHLAVEGITSTSVKPIKLISLFSILLICVSLIGILLIIIDALRGNTVAGWASLACIICFIGGMQSLFLGVIGEYIGKIYLEVKQRPRYSIAKRTAEEKKSDE